MLLRGGKLSSKCRRRVERHWEFGRGQAGVAGDRPIPLLSESLLPVSIWITRVCRGFLYLKGVVIIFEVIPVLNSYQCFIRIWTMTIVLLVLAKYKVMLAQCTNSLEIARLANEIDSNDGVAIAVSRQSTWFVLIFIALHPSYLRSCSRHYRPGESPERREEALRKPGSLLRPPSANNFVTFGGLSFESGFNF